MESFPVCVYDRFSRSERDFDGAQTIDNALNENRGGDRA
jgi:hypothetical protein